VYSAVPGQRACQAFPLSLTGVLCRRKMTGFIGLVGDSCAPFVSLEDYTVKAVENGAINRAALFDVHANVARKERRRSGIRRIDTSLSLIYKSVPDCAPSCPRGPLRRTVGRDPAPERGDHGSPRLEHR